MGHIPKAEANLMSKLHASITTYLAALKLERFVVLNGIDWLGTGRVQVLMAYPHSAGAMLCLQLAYVQVPTIGKAWQIDDKSAHGGQILCDAALAAWLLRTMIEAELLTGQAINMLPAGTPVYYEPVPIAGDERGRYWLRPVGGYSIIDDNAGRPADGLRLPHKLATAVDEAVRIIGGGIQLWADTLATAAREPGED